MQQSQFIFTEDEFEADDFNASTFVTKYRRVATLESLKEQLRTYAEGLKAQLYAVINRDYKDFISIATKVTTHNVVLSQLLCFQSSA
jgi:hypothetical protein